MKFSELQELLEKKLGIEHLADIARELKVSPQAVSNWKARDRVPYKYVVKLREKYSRAKNLITSQKINKESKEIKLDIIDQEGAKEYLHSAQINNDTYDIDKDSINFEDLVYAISKNIKILILIPLTFSFFTLVYILSVYSPLYTSSATILLEGNQKSAGLSGIASTLGIDISNNDRSDLTSTSLFPELISSRPFAERILEREFYTDKYNKKLSLLQILTVGDNIIIEKKILITKTLGLLPKMINFKSSGSFTVLSVETFEPRLAADITNAVLEELVELNRHFKNRKVIETKDFIENRMRTVEEKIDKLDEELITFRLSNRNYSSSEKLSLEYSKLSRGSSILEGMYTTLKQELELIRIEEIQAKYLIQILDYPIAPLGPSNSKGYINVILSMLAGLILSFIIIIVKNYYDSQIDNNPEKIGLIKTELKQNILNLFLDRKIYVLISIFMSTGLPFLWGHKSIPPEYFGRYSIKALTIILLYTFCCVLSLIFVIKFKKFKSFISKYIKLYL